MGRHLGSEPDSMRASTTLKDAASKLLPVRLKSRQSLLRPGATHPRHIQFEIGPSLHNSPGLGRHLTSARSGTPNPVGRREDQRPPKITTWPSSSVALRCRHRSTTSWSQNTVRSADDSAIRLPRDTCPGLATPHKRRCSAQRSPTLARVPAPPAGSPEAGILTFFPRVGQAHESGLVKGEDPR
jgi:hypothetical protein